MPDDPTDALKRVLSSRQKSSAADPSLSPAAVLLLLYPKDGEYCILLNKRSEEVEYHKGEISFPGGVRDPEDRDFQETALREAQEEMGIDSEDVTVLGELDDVVTRTGFAVRVFVGTIPYPYPFSPSSREDRQGAGSSHPGAFRAGESARRGALGGRRGLQVVLLRLRRALDFRSNRPHSHPVSGAVGGRPVVDGEMKR